jgi:hypothetical protein
MSLRAYDMNDDEHDTLLSDRDPAKLLPFSKRPLPEDPDAVFSGRHFMRETYPHQNDDKSELSL